MITTLMILSALLLALTMAFAIGLKAGVRRRRRTNLRVQSDRRPIVL